VRLAQCIAATAALAAAVAFAAEAPVAPIKRWDGKPTPALVLPDLSGETVDLQKLRGTVVVVNFWATWCEPCRDEMPALEALWRQYRARGLTVLAVSVDRGASGSVVEPYVRRQGLTFPVLLDPDMAASNAWHVTGLPATFLVKPGGEVAGFAVGSRDWSSAAMRALVESLLPARSPTTGG
jgi:peroxiredoxin